MDRIEDPQVILIDSDNEEGPSWRGIRHEGTQSSDEIPGTVMSSDDEEGEDERLEAPGDIYPSSLDASSIKKENTDDYDDIDDYVYEKISFVDFSDDEEDNLNVPSPQVPLQEVKREILSSPKTPNSGITKQVDHSPEICRGETSGKFEADLSMPIKLEECERKRESMENPWDMPRVKEEMDLDSMRSFSQEMSFCPENTGFSQSFKSLNTSEPLQDLENFTFTGISRISIDNSSDESESSGENDLEAFLEIDDLIYKTGETENLDEIVSMLDSTTFLNKNNEFSDIENSLFNTRNDERREENNTGERNSDVNITDYSQSSEILTAVDTEDFSPSLAQRGGERSQSTLDADDPFMDICTQSQVLDFNEEYSDDESEDDSSSINLQLSDRELNKVGNNEEPEGMDVTTATESGNAEKTGDDSRDEESVNESMDNDDVLSLTTTMSIQDEFPDDNTDFDDTSDEDIDEAIPIAESTGINITDWILEGQKRRLEVSDDDVQPAVKVQRLDKTMEDISFSSRIDPVEDANLAAKEISPPSAINSPESDKTPQNSLEKAVESSVKPSSPKNPQKKDFDDIQKKRKSSSRVSDSSEEENSPKIVKKSRNLKKKRKLYSRTDSIEDLTDFRDDSFEPSSNKSPGMSGKSPKPSNTMKKPWIIPVEYYKTPKTVVPTPRVNNPVNQSSSKDESTKILPVMYSDFDFLTQGMDSSLKPTETSPEPPVTLKNISTDSEEMKKSSKDSPEVENSNSAGEKSSKPSEITEDHSPEKAVEFIDLEAEDLDISTEKTLESPEDEDNPEELLPTQVSHWRPSTTLQKSSKSPENVISINSSPIIKLQESFKVTSGSPGDENSMEISLTSPQTLEFPSSKTLIQSKVFQEDETSKIFIRETINERPSTPLLIELSDDEEMLEASAPAATPENETNSFIKSSSSQISRPSELTKPLPLDPIPVYTLTDDEEETEVDPVQVSNPSGAPVDPPKVSNSSGVQVNPPQVINPPEVPVHQQNDSTDEESQHLTHISQLRKSPPVPSNQPEPQPSISRDGSISPTDMERLIVYPTDDPKGWITEDDNETDDEVPEEDPKDNSSKSIDSEASDDDSASNSSKSSSEIQSIPQSEDSDYQNFKNARSIPPKFSKPREKKCEIKKETKSKIKKPNYLHHPLPKSINNAPAGEKTQEEATKTIKAISKIHSQLQNKPSPDVRMKTPKNMQVKLLDHQKYALPWMLWREDCEPAGGILADDMGLGKTITTIALIMKSLERERKQKKKKNNHQGGTLIVCPAHLISQWQQEIESKGEIARVRSYHKEKERNISILRNLSVVITSYETLANDFKSSEKILFKIHWTRVVLDEAHYIRNSGTVKSDVVNELITDKRWALTGTPIHNEVKDIFAILRFLRLEPFHNLKHFNKWMGNHDEAGTARLHCVIKCVMLRRSKMELVAEGMMPQLPMKTDRIIQVSLKKEERLVYERVMILSRTLFIQFLHQKIEKKREMAAGGDYLWSRDLSNVKLSKRQVEFLMRRGTVTHHHLLTLILRLRQCCDHPSLIQDTLDEKDFEAAGVEKPNFRDLREANKNVLEDLSALEEDDDEDDVIGVDERIIEGNVPTKGSPVFDEKIASSKMIQMLEEVKNILRKNEKIVIVSDWVKYLKMIGKHLTKMPETAGKFGFYTGERTSDERKSNVYAFNDKDGKMMILLLSLKAGGQGLNLTAANHVMIMDVHWNPQLEVQAEDRVYRIGQKKNVIIHKFIVMDTIEERIVQLQKRKMRIAEAVLSGSSQNEINNLQLEEMCSLFNL